MYTPDETKIFLKVELTLINLQFGVYSNALTRNRIKEISIIKTRENDFDLDYFESRCYCFLILTTKGKKKLFGLCIPT